MDCHLAKKVPFETRSVVHCCGDHLWHTPRSSAAAAVFFFHIRRRPRDACDQINATGLPAKMHKCNAKKTTLFAYNKILPLWQQIWLKVWFSSNRNNQYTKMECERIPRSHWMHRTLYLQTNEPWSWVNPNTDWCGCNARRVQWNNPLPGCRQIIIEGNRVITVMWFSSASVLFTKDMRFNISPVLLHTTWMDWSRALKLVRASKNCVSVQRQKRFVFGFSI